MGTPLNSSSAGLYFPEKCRSDIIAMTHMSTNTNFSNPGHPPSAGQDHRKRVKELADAVSTQAQISNRAWFATMVVAAYAILPHVGGNIKLPFGIGEVSRTVFYSVIYPLLIILIIAFSAAHAQQLNAQSLAQRTLDRFGDAETDGIKLRTWFDLWRKPSLNRVAPLVQSMRVELTHLGAKWKKRSRVRGIVMVCYWVLKVIALLVYFVLPGVSLWYAYNKVPFVGTLRWVFAGLGTIASLALLLGVVAEIRYAVGAARNI